MYIIEISLQASCHNVLVSRASEGLQEMNGLIQDCLVDEVFTSDADRLVFEGRFRAVRMSFRFRRGQSPEAQF